MKKGRIIILDFGSQSNQLIARRAREIGVYTEGAPSLDIKLFEKNIPILGFYYGMQFIIH